MKAITHDLSASGNDVKIVPLADLHIGDSQSDMKLIKNMLDAILNLPDTYCILGGDLMDSAIASSIGDTYAAKLQPMEQLEKCVELFSLPTQARFSAYFPATMRTEFTRQLA